ncbi:hypothetical protein [Streptomyces sp. L2]|uniref:hypothetical protein n=1 Tax=Streptomyces sp. L2 TaxID=2162665 RepID=UPI001010BD8B|nr:hypothetical protein [Streptomyces sp. L2]
MNKDKDDAHQVGKKREQAQRSGGAETGEKWQQTQRRGRHAREENKDAQSERSLSLDDSLGTIDER